MLNDLETVHDLNREAEPFGCVPLPDDLNSDVRYDFLLELEHEFEQDFRSESTKRRYRVDELLNGVRRDQDVVVVRHSADTHTQPHTVILIHGIRTTALWQDEIRRSLETRGFKVELTNYGRFNLLRFLCPGQFFRRQVLRDIAQQVRDIASQAGSDNCSIIAHSFGTFIVAGMLLRESPELKFRRIIFCGSVVQYRFRVVDYIYRFDEPLINEVGTRDIWPVLAQTMTTGYGSAGTCGFRRSGVHDRWHNGKTHSDFLTCEFCERYWVPFLGDGTIIEDDAKAESPPWWLQIVATVQPRYLIAAACILWFVEWFVVRLLPPS